MWVSIGPRCGIVAKVHTSNDHGELGDRLAAHLREGFLEVAHLFLKDCGVLSLRNTIANVQHTLRGLAATDTLHPVLGHRLEVLLDVGGGHHLDTVAVRLDLSPVARKERIGGNRDGCKRSSFTGSCTRSRVRHISSNDHGALAR